MPENKELKISYGINSGQHGQAMSMLRSLTQEVLKLGKAMNSVFGGGKGINVGGATIPGTGGINKQAPGGGGGAFSKDMFKDLASTSKDAFKAMSVSLRESVRDQKREVEVLSKSFEDLSKRINGVRTATKGGAPGAALMSEWQETGEKLGQAKTGLASTEQQLAAMQPGATTPGAKTGFWARQMQGLTGPNSMIGTMGRAMGLPPGMMGAMAGSAGLAAVGAWGIGGIKSEVMNQPDQFLNQSRAMGQAFSARQMEMLGGDFRNMAAKDAILSDPEMAKSYRSHGSWWRRAGHTLSALYKKDFTGALSGNAATLGVRAAQENQISMLRESDPVADQLASEFLNYNGTLGTMRAWGLGAGVKHGNLGLKALYSVRKSYAGFSDAEIGAAKGGVEQASTRSGSWRLAGGVMQGTAAGIGNMASTVGTMAKYGEGKAMSMALRALAGGGADVITSGILGQYVAGVQDQMGYTTGAGQGQGLLSMLSAGTGAPGGAGRLAAEQNIKGAGWMQQSLAGQTSNYQAARNTMMAMQVAPGLGAHGVSMLSRNMSITEMADLATGTGDVSEVFKQMGGTPEQARSFFKKYSKSLTEGVSEANLRGGSKKLFAAMNKSGMDPREFFAQPGVLGTLGMSESEAQAAYAGILKSSQGMDTATAMGTAGNLMGRRTVAPGAPVGDVAGGAKEKDLAREHLGMLDTAVLTTTGKFNQVQAAAENLALNFTLLNEMIQSMRASGVSEQSVFDLVYQYGGDAKKVRAAMAKRASDKIAAENKEAAREAPGAAGNSMMPGTHG